MKSGLALCLVLTVLSGPATVTGLEGTWRVCLTRTGSTQQSCGEIRVDTLSRMTFRNGTQLRYHRLIHTLDLANVMGPRYSRLDRFGSILFYEKPQQVMIELGLGPEQVVVGDGGFFTAFLEWNGDSTAFVGVDSLAGGWGITCRGGCPGSGRIVLRRVTGGGP